ncbi:protein FORGETTER 1-like isoform X1 [Chenopodium quinoa]|uniref:protein FORGETTER 1-like isoform X1 n=1 Tax=Chenopodium quinoa TaxID=63459 RepID=UPI000B77AD48|nr:protein FORGETTER 1-like isoform X1 [Chenopodium quinoa]
MSQPSLPPPIPPPLPSPPNGGLLGGVAPCQVRCAGCRLILTVAAGVAEFVCPTCRLPQMLPPELLKNFRPVPPMLPPLPPPNPNPNPNSVGPPIPTPPIQAQGIDPNKMQLPCANCKAILNVPHGLARFKCPQCDIDLAVDVSKIKQFLLPPPEEVNEVAIEVEQEEGDGGTVGETFTDYRPPKLSIGPPHPDPIVETSSLSAVQPPEPTYDLEIKEEIVHSKALSCLQLETLVYASQRHLQHLPNGERAGFFIGDGAGVGKGRTIAGLIWENWQHRRRKALWISVGSDLKFDSRRDLDDVGATSVEVHALNKLPYGKLDSKSVGIKEGVLFSTYSSLIASSEKGKSRLSQLVQWCGGRDFDGLVIFDECHKAKNLVPEAGGQPTRTGEAVLELQDKLPEARVVYCSATGASEPRNMGYMVRLGLWGAGTSFLNFKDFLGALEKGGVGALELVAMDMKARGMFVCRTLSYKGAEFEVIEAPLDPKMMEMYKKAAEFWAELRVELLTASAFHAEEKPNSSQLWRLYWASHQRFFRHLCMSAKVPTVVKLAKKALKENKCVVVGLQSTGEARTEEAISKYGLELDDFVSGPRELLLKFVEENYPLPEKPEPLPVDDEGVKELPRKRHSADPDVSFKGRLRKAAKWKAESDEDSFGESESDNDNESTESDDEFQICDICNGEEDRKKLLKCACCGKLVHPSCLDPPVPDVSEEWTCNSCQQKTEEFLQAKRAYIEELTKRYEEAVERKIKIMEIIRSLDLPNNPLDDIIDQLGGPDNVAEITGRRGMLVRASCGKGVTYQARNTKEVTMEMVNMHEKQLFMDGKKFIAIISEAGSAGVSLQADRRALNQRRRVHLTLELPWSADRAIQQFGRTHRSNQASAPEYRLLFTNLGGERRFASIVAKRLESLGALTQGDRRAGPSLSAYNYDSAYGKRALMVMYKGILEQDSLPVVPPGCSTENPGSIQDFITKAKAALVSVGIVRDTVNGKESGKISGRIVDSDMHDVGRFLNRLLGLPPEIQNRIFELFISVLDVIIQNARTEGNLDSGIVDIKANIIELQGKPKTVHVDQMSGASTVLFTFTLDRGSTWEFASNLLNEKQKGLGSTHDGFYESKREWLGRRHFLLAFEGSTSGFFKIVRPAVGEVIREMPLSELKNKYRKISSLEKARSGWEDEYEVSSRQCMHGPNCKVGSYCTVGRRLQEVNVLGGLILPIWNAIEKALSKQARQSHRRVRVVRIETTTDSQRIVGLLIPNAAVDDVLDDLAWDRGIDD